MTRLIAIGIAVMLVVEPSMGSPLSPGKTFVPQSNAFRGAIIRRQCVAAAPNVDRTMVSGVKSLQSTSFTYKPQIISDACNQNPQNNITSCASELSACPSTVLFTTTGFKD